MRPSTQLAVRLELREDRLPQGSYIRNSGREPGQQALCDQGRRIRAARVVQGSRDSCASAPWSEPYHPSDEPVSQSRTSLAHCTPPPTGRRDSQQFSPSSRRGAAERPGQASRRAAGRVVQAWILGSLASLIARRSTSCQT